MNGREDYIVDGMVQWGRYCQALEEENAKLRKALDKACDELEYFQGNLFATERDIVKLARANWIEDGIEHRNTEEWKEWCMSDE